VVCLIRYDCGARDGLLHALVEVLVNNLAANRRLRLRWQAMDVKSAARIRSRGDGGGHSREESGTKDRGGTKAQHLMLRIIR
jgi:hypothetical protein